MQKTIIIILFFLIFQKVDAQEIVSDPAKNPKTSLFSWQGALLYNIDLNNDIVDSYGISSKLGLFASKNKRHFFGFSVNWRIIPGIFYRSSDSRLSEIFLQPAKEYTGSDSLFFRQLARALSNEENYQFNGMNKVGIDVAYQVKLNAQNRIGASVGILSRQYRTDGADTLSNSYGEPGYYWLQTGVGYSVTIEWQVQILNKMKFKDNLSYHLICGMNCAFYDVRKFEYGDVNLMNALNIDEHNYDLSVNNIAVNIGLAVHIMSNKKSALKTP